jgi:YbbR domain-containing protein
MTAEATLKQRLKRAVRENAGLKLFSLLVSLGLFTAVHGSDAGQRTFTVSVVALLPPPSSGKILVGDLPDKVKLTLTGSRSVLNSLGAVDTVQIDLTKAQKYYYFEPEQFGIPAGIDVQVTPPTLALAWEDRMERKLTLRAQLSGTPDASLELAGPAVATPQRVTVQGPSSSVHSLTDLPLEPISLVGLGAGVHRRRVPLLPLPKHVTVVDGGDITVELALEPKREQRRLKRLPVAVIGTSAEFVLRPAHVDVVITAPKSVLADVDPEHVVPVVDLSQLEVGKGAVGVTVTLRGIEAPVQLVRMEPRDVLAKLK